MRRWRCTCVRERRIEWDIQEAGNRPEYRVHEHGIAMADVLIGCTSVVAEIGPLIGASWGYRWTRIPGAILTNHALSLWTGNQVKRIDHDRPRTSSRSAPCRRWRTWRPASLQSSSPTPRSWLPIATPGRGASTGGGRTHAWRHLMSQPRQAASLIPVVGAAADAPRPGCAGEVRLSGGEVPNPVDEPRPGLPRSPCGCAQPPPGSGRRVGSECGVASVLAETPGAHSSSMQQAALPGVRPPRSRPGNHVPGPPPSRERSSTGG